MVRKIKLRQRTKKTLFFAFVSLIGLTTFVEYGVDAFGRIRDSESIEQYLEVESAVSYMAEQLNCLQLASAEGIENDREVFRRAREICEEQERSTKMWGMLGAIIGVFVGLIFSIPAFLYGIYGICKEISGAYKEMVGANDT